MKLASPYLALVIAFILAGVALSWQHHTKKKLQSEIELLTSTTSRESHVGPLSPGSTQSPAIDGKRIFTRIAKPMFDAAEISDKDGAAKLIPQMQEQIARLGTPQLIALVEQDPDFSFRHHYIIGRDTRDWIEAHIIYRALDRLFKLALQEGLRLTIDSGAGGPADNNVWVHRFVSNALSRWGSRDFEAAWAWLESHEDRLWEPQNKRYATLSGLVETDIVAAMAVVREKGMLSDETLLQLSASVGMGEERAAFFDAVDDLPDSVRRESYYWAYLERLHNVEGFTAAREFVEYAIVKLGDASWDNEMTMRVAMNHVIDDPAAKAAWLAEVSAPEFQRANLEEFIDRWVRRDPRSAAQTLAQTSGDALPDPVRIALSERLAHQVRDR